MISVVIPAYNEEKRIKKTIEAIKNILLLHTNDFEILVINDGSCDQTKTVVSSLEGQHIKLFSYEKNRGKGGAVKYGIKKARGEYIVFTDADLPYPPEKIITACKMLSDDTDVILGMRVESKNGEKYPWYRNLMSKGFGIFVRMVLGCTQKDTQCGFKAFKKEVANNIFEKMQLSGWGFDVEMIFLAEKLKYRIQRLEVELNHEKKGSKINIIQDTLQMMKEVFMIKKIYKKGKYNL